MHQISAITAEPAAPVGDGVHKLQEFVVGGQVQFALGDLGSSDAASGIFVANATADTEINHHLEGGQGIVVNGGRVLRVKSRGPFPAFGIAEFGETGVFEGGPALEQRRDGLASVELGPGLQLDVGVKFFFEMSQRLTEGCVAFQ